MSLLTFKFGHTSLVEDLFVKENSGESVTIAMDKVTLLIWLNRRDPSLVKFVAEFLTKYSNESNAIANGIEFYLPQLMHMIIHLETQGEDWPDSTLEMFSLTVAQQSLHFALQMYWILSAAIEDYRPADNVSEKPNENFNPVFYRRCIKLRANLERSVVFGDPHERAIPVSKSDGSDGVGDAVEEYKIINKGNGLDSHEKPSNCSTEDAVEINDGDKSSVLKSKCGWLLYKRRWRQNFYSRKTWKLRFFVVEDRMLYCYTEDVSLTDGEQGNVRLKRAMSLEGAKIVLVPIGTYKDEHGEHTNRHPNCFEIVNKFYKFKLRASSKEQVDQWIELLQTEATHPTTLFGPSVDVPNLMNALSPDQLSRYTFFKDYLKFVANVCDVAEKLRFEDPSVRKAKLPETMDAVPVPETAYVPMVKGTDAWAKVTALLGTESRVFNTNERCPVLMYFRTEKSKINTSVKDHLKSKYGISSSSGDIAKANEVGEEEIETERVDFDVNVSVRMKAAFAEKPKITDQIMFANKLVQKFVHESYLDQLPNILTNTLSSSQENRSTLDQATKVESVKLEVGSETFHSSVHQIDEESIIRAKNIVCGGELWEEKQARMLASKDTSNEDVVEEITSVIVKSNDDLRQEMFCMQLIHYYQSVFANAQLDVLLRPYGILSCSKDTGLIETLTNSTSLDGLKKSLMAAHGHSDMNKYFEQVYGNRDGETFKAAQSNFMRSLAGYSLVSYLLGLKDRHNGNIMIDVYGRLIFIDFGFAMGMAPGHEFSLERASFKLTQDYIDIMGGFDSECFAEFKRLFTEGLLIARSKANSQMALGLIEIMMYKSNYPCFSGSRYGGNKAIARFEKRLMLSTKSEEKVRKKVEAMIMNAANHMGTGLYDQFQLMSNGYLP